MARGSEEHPRGKSPLALVRTWRARDCHTGIGRGQGIPYTYRQVEATPEAAAEVYRIETFIPFTDRLIHRNVHYVPAAKLDSFFDLWEHAETIVEIRQLTMTAALEELRAFRTEAE